MDLVFDIETNGLLEEVSELHCIVISEVVSGDTKTYYGATIDQGLARLQDANTLIGHNIIRYDIPVINKLTGVDLRYKKVHDTLIMAQIRHPDMMGSHSLGALFTYYNIPFEKVENTDWSALTPRILDRCNQDTKGNRLLYIVLRDSVEPKALELECDIAKIHTKQVAHGVRYNVNYATSLYQEWTKEIHRKTKVIQEQAPWSTEIEGIPLKRQEEVRQLSIKEVAEVPFTTPLKANLQPNINCIKYWATYGKEAVSWKDSEYSKDTVKIGGNYTRLNISPLDLNNSKKVKDYLLELGWEPTQWNFNPMTRMRTSPKLTEDSYFSLPPGLGQEIADLNTLKHRTRSLFSYKDNGKHTGSLSLVRSDGRVPAEAITCGTPTSRYRHKGAVCNLARPSSPYGKEIRRCYCVPEKRLMIGVDLSGIEARKLAHFAYPYKGGVKLAETILDGDFHLENSKTWSVSRNTAKSILYALMYGAGAAKLASIAGTTNGQAIKDAFYNANPCVKELIDDLEYSYRVNGTIKGLDRVIYVREKRMVLNSLLQQSAAVVFKVWMRYINNNILPKYLFAKQIIAYHDELQFEWYNDDKVHATRFAEEVCKAATITGTLLGLNVRINADYSIGVDYSETH